MLRKIDCVLVRVDALEAAEAFYVSVFGLRPIWRDESAVGLALPETDAEVVLHTMDLPPGQHVHYLVDDVADAVVAAERGGCVVRTAPFDVAVGKCAVIEDPFGNAVCLIDLSKGMRPTL
ncbi:VOC family protein [Actinoplanes sp. M2I2]|uniref:VOC family protein n=1 Tax=Actinoplanes sp. M2I2 TaxID=1734444 RepID=UPI00201FE14E|nr:VOC family protein [Actinoplanes sp. M2I2]